MLSSAFNIGASGLQAMQRSVDTFSRNIANANTPGYRRMDPLLADRFDGGVSFSSVHRFNPLTATRLSQVAGESASSDTLAASLNGLQSQLSGASTDMASAQNELATALAQAAMEPDNATARVMAGEKAQTFAAIGNSHLQALDGLVGDEIKAQAGVRTQAEGKLQELYALNQAAARSGLTPDLRNQQAQVGRELSQLVGGEVSFEGPNARFSINNQPMLGANGPFALPATVGGAAGAHAQAQAQITAARDKFAANLSDFADKMNTLNSQGVDATGAPGGKLFNMSSTQQFTFAGTAQGMAFSTPTGVGSIAQQMVSVDSVASATGQLAAQAGAQAQTALGIAKADSASMQSMDAQQQAQEGVDIDNQMIALKNAQRAYEANAKLIQVADSMIGTLLDIKS